MPIPRLVYKNMNILYMYRHYCILFPFLNFKGNINKHKITKKITKRTVGAIKIHAVNLFQIFKLLNNTKDLSTYCRGEK